MSRMCIMPVVVVSVRKIGDNQVIGLVGIMDSPFSRVIPRHYRRSEII
jgi:hypothetical protein